MGKIKAGANTVLKKGSIAKKTSVSATDIRQATESIELDRLKRRVEAMEDGNIKNALMALVKQRRKVITRRQADEVDKMGRRQQQTRRDKKMKGKVTLPETPFNKGGMLKKPSAGQTGIKKLPTSVRNKMGYFAKGGYANCGASMKATQKSTQSAK